MLSMLIGVVGKPSAGKSTFFKAATLAQAEIANYPFTTIKPNRAVGFVRIDCVDKEFNKQCNPRTGWCQNNQRFVPVELLDVAGLVPGAHKGEGMGLQFLNDLNQADALIHVVDISGSTDATGKVVDPLSYDPLNDVVFLEKELDYWFLAILNRGWDRFIRLTKQEHSELHSAIAKQLSGLDVNEDIVKASVKEFSLPPNLEEWSDKNKFDLARSLRTQTKPIIIAANKIDIEGAEKNFSKLKKEYPNYLIIPCSADSELALRQAEKQKIIDYIPGDGAFAMNAASSTEQAKALDFILNHVLKPFGSTGIQQVLNSAVFDLLKYIAIYPGGVSKLEDSEGRVLPDCFLMQPGSTALDFAYRLHTDFGKNFIKAINVKTKMAIGKEHPLAHRDVIEIMAKT